MTALPLVVLVEALVTVFWLLIFLYVILAAFMGNVQLSCLMLQPVWPTRMFLHGIEIFVGEELFIDCQHYTQLNWWYAIESEMAFPSLFAGFVKTSPLFSVETKLMSRTGRSRQSKLPSTGRKICNTMRSRQRVTTTLRSLFCTLLESLQGNQCS